MTAGNWLRGALEGTGDGADTRHRLQGQPHISLVSATEPARFGPRFRSLIWRRPARAVHLGRGLLAWKLVSKLSEQISLGI